MAIALLFRHYDALAAEFKGILSQGFDPRHVPTLKLWLEASNLASILKDGSNKVSKWIDKSGQNNHAIQSDTAKEPTYTTNVQNGFSAIRTNGISEYMESTLPLMANVTILFVAISRVNSLPDFNVQAFMATAPSGATPTGWSTTGKTWNSTTDRRLRAEGNSAHKFIKMA